MERDGEWLLGWYANRRHYVGPDVRRSDIGANTRSLCGAGVFSSDDEALSMEWRRRIVERRPPPRCKRCERMRQNAINQ